VQIGKRKDNELEVEKWTDKVFTGDNAKLTAFLSGEARNRQNQFNTDYKKRRTLSQEPSINEGGKPVRAGAQAATFASTMRKEAIHANTE
jgi:hypothetical protein